MNAPKMKMTTDVPPQVTTPDSVETSLGTLRFFDESLLDSKSLFLTGNTDSVYFSNWLNLKNGPLVLESPPKVLG